MSRGHSPQDELYGPLSIPAECWPIIDTPEFQRMRHIMQLGICFYVYPSATHTRFEHSLGVCHLATIFMNHIRSSQPELGVTDEQALAVQIAGLCHDLGHGPFSHCFESIAHMYNENFDHEAMSIDILKFIIKKYDIKIKDEVIDAACYFIMGRAYPGYPKWLSRIIADKESDIDLDKFDYLGRDSNRSLSLSRFEYDRLILNCRVVEGQLAWRVSETHTIERLFFNRNDMHKRVYQHKTNQSINLMIDDIMAAADSKLRFADVLDDPESYCKLDDRILTYASNGDFGEEAQRLMKAISERRFFQLVGELRMSPTNNDGLTYSQIPNYQMEEDIAQYGSFDVNMIKVVKMSFRYGLKPYSHPLKYIPFWKPGYDKIFYLTDAELSCIAPVFFFEKAFRVFTKDPSIYEEVKKAFDKWKQNKCMQ